MSDPNLIESVADAPPIATPKNAVRPRAIELLDGDEIIQLSIKPSLWYIPLVSLNVAVTMGLVATALAFFATRAGWSLAVSVAFQAILGIAALRVAIGALQWASQLYVLTNRRVIRFRGVLSVHFLQCPLARIQDVRIDVSSHQRLLRLGSIRMTPAADNPVPIVWEELSRPGDVHEILVRAIRKAQTGE